MVIPCLFTLLWAFLLAALAASAGTGVGADVVGNWTLYGFSRSCSAEDNKCQYSFDLNENTGPENYLNCFLTVNGTYQSDFHNQYCNERFVVDGGWNRDDGPKGAFIVVVVTDLAVGANAFFSFKEQDFEDVGIVEYTESSPAYSLSAAWETKRQRDGGDDVAVAAAGVGDYDHDSNEHTISPPLGSQGGVGTGAGELVARQQDDLGKMQIQQLRRIYQSDSKSLFTSFDISTTGGDDVRCELRIVDTEPAGSWYSRGPCSNYTISWGYNSEFDSAVMAVCNSAVGHIAFFGFDGVTNFAKTYPASPWEPLRNTGCR